MNRIHRNAALCALALVGAASVQSIAAPAAKDPQLVGKPLTITCKVTPATATSTGVVLAQGGAMRGYALYLKSGKPIFFVRQAGKLYTAKATTAPRGPFTLEAHLLKTGAMTLAVNGSVVAKGKAPGLFAMQPKDPFSVGQDTLGAVGDYKAPSPLKAKVQNVKVTAK